MIEEHYLKLLTMEGWIDRYWEMLPDYDTMEQTYEAIERQYEQAFGTRKYADFASFRASFYRYMKNREK